MKPTPNFNDAIVNIKGPAKKAPKSRVSSLNYTSDHGVENLSMNFGMSRNFVTTNKAVKTPKKKQSERLQTDAHSVVSVISKDGTVMSPFGARNSMRRAVGVSLPSNTLKDDVSQRSRFKDPTARQAQPHLQSTQPILIAGRENVTFQRHGSNVRFGQSDANTMSIEDLNRSDEGGLIQAQLRRANETMKNVYL